jgi:hypothetical protein
LAFDLAGIFAVLLHNDNAEKDDKKKILSSSFIR